jgi:hypothetical protein
MKTFVELKKDVMFQEKSGIKWAPLTVSMQRRMETFAAFTFIFIVLFAEIISLGIFGAIFVSSKNYFYEKKKTF